jgi:hypothetical protein
MNSPLDEGQLVSFEHMNRAQKRAFILRDQLKYEEEQHLDVFIDGIRNPEPPRYKRTANGVQPPCEEVTVKHSTTRFDLGNVEFSDKSVRRVFLVCAGDSYEMHESDAISPDEDDFNSVPLNYYVAQKIMPSFKKKYEAIHARVQRINELRQHMYDQASNRPLKAPSRFKEGKVGRPMLYHITASLCRTMLFYCSIFFLAFDDYRVYNCGSSPARNACISNLCNSL